MSTETIDRVLDQIEMVDKLVITGGEPLLAKDTLLYLLREIKRRKVKIGYIDMTCNGTIRDAEIAKAFMDIVVDGSISGYKPYIGVSISNDKWHKEFETDEDINAAQAWWIEQTADEPNIEIMLHDANGTDKTGLQFCGRAKNLKAAEHSHPVIGYFCKEHRVQVEYNDSGFFIKCTLQVDCDGSIILDNNVFAWEDVPRLSLGNVNDASILDIVTAHNAKHPVYCEDCDRLRMAYMNEIGDKLFAGNDARTKFNITVAEAEQHLQDEAKATRARLDDYCKAFDLNESTPINDLLRIEDVFFEFVDGVLDIVKRAYKGSDENEPRTAANDILNRMLYGNGTHERVIKQILRNIGIDEHSAVMTAEQIHRMYNAWMKAMDAMKNWAQTMQAARKMHPALTELEICRFVNAMIAYPDKRTELEAEATAYEDVYDTHKEYPTLTPDKCRLLCGQRAHTEPTEKKIAHGQEVPAQELRKYNRHLNVIKAIVSHQE